MYKFSPKNSNSILKDMLHWAASKTYTTSSDLMLISYLLKYGILHIYKVQLNNARVFALLEMQNADEHNNLEYSLSMTYFLTGAKILELVSRC